MKARPKTSWERWIALCLLCYPRRFRQRFGADLSMQYHEPGNGRVIRAGLQAARDLARGGLGARVDDLRAAWSTRASGSGVDGLLVDIRHSLRSLTHRPLFTLTVIATFALAASLNAAVFAILDTTLLRPLPVRDEVSIVSIGSEWVNFRHSSVSVPEWPGLTGDDSTRTHPGSGEVRCRGAVRRWNGIGRGWPHRAVASGGDDDDCE